jgi:hypothetical protein
VAAEIDANDLVALAEVHDHRLEERQIEADWMKQDDTRS